ncbi:hypothetical protein EOJ41_18845 [Vibrio alginolyticus]|uniref:hypothetical protein n=1 Tax=Vibrio alginolyticus TaxID=663 RepID=UPI00102DC123|nr:hypothetical protein [Vibrio alginolyticus]MDF4711352.1 hypothetical protein [Vibrio parahaemolyticus]RZV16323.1 hypothetical protein EOJ41_18845 [Vibrio alginolyticus]
MYINRKLPSVSIPLGSLKYDPNYVKDELTIEKFQKFMSGKLKVYASRLNIDEIKPGFYLRKENGLKYIYNKPNSDYVEIVKNNIRRGMRPPLYLYKNIKKGEEMFLCTDDFHAYNAYLELGIKSVPVYVYSSKDGLKEASYSLKALILKNIEEGEDFPLKEYVDGFEPYTPKTKLYSWNGERCNILDFLGVLISDIDRTQDKLKLFHIPGHEFHYHHTMFSVLNRLKKHVMAIKVLFENDLILSSANIVRSIYELALVFYIDWLSPDLMNRYMQLVSVTTEKERNKIVDEIASSQIEEGVKKKDVKILKASMVRCCNLATTVSEKAKMFIYSEEEHKDIYSTLSNIAHHDFSQIQRDLELLTSDRGDEYVEDIIDPMISLVDTIVCTVLLKINNDIGYPCDIT